MNNQQAQIQVGDNIPISQTTVNTSGSDTTLSSVEYVHTGVILDVVPRINPGGLVYLDIQQQVSDANTSAVTTAQPNPRISTRSVSTQSLRRAGRRCYSADWSSRTMRSPPPACRACREFLA